MSWESSRQGGGSPYLAEQKQQRALLRYLEEEGVIRMDALLRAQDPPLSPQLLLSAADKYLPDLKPDFARMKRVEIYDAENKIFR